MDKETKILYARARDAFGVFDAADNDTCEAVEVPTILAALDIYPAKSEVLLLTAQMEEAESQGFVKFEKFWQIVHPIMSDGKYRMNDIDTILDAFSVLDQEKKGYLTISELVNAMTTQGEQMSQEEMDEMLTKAVDPLEHTIIYNKYAKVLTDV